MRTISLHDSRSGQLTALEPRDAGRVGIYACGPTVYSRVHVGNARPYVVFSLLKRFLEHEGLEATLVANITDINDKIYAAARKAGVASEALAAEMTERYKADTERLGLGRPDHEPLASEYVEAIVALIADLVERGHAYAVDGDVYFRVRSLPAYGELSHRAIDEMDQGEGVEGAARKQDSLDFALWKGEKEDEDKAWPSPWGLGRPGWHIECSAMAEELLGVELDIHGGGVDLLFPHHENEAAQTLAARGRPLARLWMHNGMLQLDDEKMAKSEGNIRGLGDVLDEVGRDTLLMYFVAGHYRQPIAYSRERLDAAAAAVERVREAGRRVSEGDSPEDLAPLRDAFFDALADDFNTARALASLFDWIREANRRDGPVGDAHLREMLGVLGLDNLLDAAEGPPPELVELARAARSGAGGPRLRRGGPAARRAAGRRLGGPRRRGRPGARAGGVILYGVNPVREALRGPRDVRRIWAARGDWSGAPVTRATPEEIAARCGSDAHQGVCAEVEDFRYADAAKLLARPEPFLVALDEVTDPQNLGAVCRTAEVAGATGVVLPQRRSAEVTPGRLQGVRGRRRAPGDRPGPQPRRLPRAGQGRGLLVLRRRGRRADALPGPGLPRRGRPGARRGGQRPQAEGEGCVRRPGRAAHARAHRFAQRQRCRGGAYVRDIAAAA